MPESGRLKDLIGLLVIELESNDPRVQKAQKAKKFCGRLMPLIVLFFGAITPIADENPAPYVRYIGLASVLILVVLAGNTLFRRLR